MTTSVLKAGLNLVAAVEFGVLIGLERQWRQRLAGLRTSTLVALDHIIGRLSQASGVSRAGFRTQTRSVSRGLND